MVIFFLMAECKKCNEWVRPHTHTHRDITILPKTQLFFLKKNCIFQKKFRKKNIFWEKNSMHDCYAAVVLRLADSGNPSRGATMMWLWKSLPWCYGCLTLEVYFLLKLPLLWSWHIWPYREYNAEIAIFLSQCGCGNHSLVHSYAGQVLSDENGEEVDTENVA